MDEIVEFKNKVVSGFTRLGQIRPADYRGIVNEFHVGNGQGQVKTVSVEFCSSGEMIIYQGMGDSVDRPFIYGCLHMGLNKEEALFLIKAIKAFDHEEYFSYIAKLEEEQKNAVSG